VSEAEEMSKTETTASSEAAGAQDPPERRTRKIRQGTVVSDRGEKTVVVRVDRRLAHPLYGKSVTRSKKYHAHDENNEYQVGDVVRIQETRPLSRLKRWRVVELVDRPERV
jgi:small subunit ribosomal protein S17